MSPVTVLSITIERKREEDRNTDKDRDRQRKHSGLSSEKRFPQLDDREGEERRGELCKVLPREEERKHVCVIV